MNQAWAFKLLSLLWCKPASDTLSCLIDHEKSDLIKKIWIEAGFSRHSIENLLNDAKIDLSVLDQEYERLFVGPGFLPCPPYESVWQKDQSSNSGKMVMGSCTTELNELYSKLGIQLSQQNSELPDHIAVELEALSYSMENYELAELNTIFGKHLASWLPAFCSSVVENSALPFYKTLANTTMLFIELYSTEEN